MGGGRGGSQEKILEPLSTSQIEIGHLGMWVRSNICCKMALEIDKKCLLKIIFVQKVLIGEEEGSEECSIFCQTCFAYFVVVDRTLAL